jgi:hypothetical protein
MRAYQLLSLRLDRTYLRSHRAPISIELLKIKSFAYENPAFAGGLMREVDRLDSLK